MRKESQLSPVMMELLVVTLFLALSASVLIQLIARAHDISVDATVQSRALILAQDALERMKADPVGDGAFDENGLRTIRETRDGLVVIGTLQRQSAGAGAYYAITAEAYDGASQLLSLSTGRYLPETEVTP